MTAIVKVEARLSKDEADAMRETIKHELAEGGFGNDIPVMLFGDGADVTLLDDDGGILFSTVANSETKSKGG